MSDARSVELPGDAELAYSGTWMGSLRRQPVFRELELTEATDDVLQQVGEMHWLKVLKLRGSFSDTGTRYLRGLSALADLALDSDRLHGEAPLPSAPLRSVSLTGERISDAAPATLSGYPDLAVLRLASATATGTGLALLPSSLQMLYLRLPLLNSDTLDTLRRLPALRAIVFAGTEPSPRLARRLAALSGTLTRVEFLGVNAPHPEILQPLNDAGIRVNAAEPM